jgi:hypothetical protein
MHAQAKASSAAYMSAAQCSSLPTLASILLDFTDFSSYLAFI